MDELEQQARDAMPAKQKEDPIQKCLREQRENKVENLEDMIKFICEKYPEHYFDHIEKYCLNDGTPIAYIYLRALDSAVSFDVKAFVCYDKDKKSWTIDDTCYYGI